MLTKGQLLLFTITFTLLDASFPIIWATVGDVFGRRHFATIRGMMSFFYMWGSFAGPVMAGPIYDHTQSYMMVLWILLILLTFATLLVLFLIRPWSNRMTALNPFSQFGVSNAIQKDFSRSLP